MKHLIILSFFVTLLVCKVSAQSKPSSADTTVWGSIQTNFPGGQEGYNKYITDSAKYPKEALENEVDGSTYLRLTIEKDGSISDVKVYRGIGSPMDVIAWKLIRNSGKWIPASVNGSPVRTNCKAAVSFVFKRNNTDGAYGIVTGEAKDPRLLKGK